MSAITKERIELFIKNPLDNGLTRGEQMELARIALASLEAEPVVWKVTFTQIDREYNTITRNTHENRHEQGFHDL